MNNRSFGFLYSAIAGRISRKDFYIGLAGLVVAGFLFNYVLGVFFGVGLAALLAVDFTQTELFVLGAELHKVYWFHCWPLMLIFTPPFVALCIKRFADIFVLQPAWLWPGVLVLHGYVFSLGALILKIPVIHAVAMLVHLISLGALVLLGAILPSRAAD